MTTSGTVRALQNSSKVIHKTMVGPKEDVPCAGSRLSWDDLHEVCSKSCSEDGLECPVCWEGFNHGNNLPYVLWCGHSLCKSCLMGLQCASVKLPVVPVQLPLFVSCPWCQFLSCRLVWKGKLKYPCKNFFLLWLVESLIKGETKQCHEFSRSEDKLCRGTASSQHAYDQPSQHVLHNDYQAPSSSYAVRHFSATMGNDDFAAQQPLEDTFFLHRWFKKVTGVCAKLLAKCMLLLLAMLILFCVLPFSTIILMVYFTATLIFAFPSFLVVYFTFPTLSWLLREIAT